MNSALPLALASLLSVAALVAGFLALVRAVAP